MRLCFVEDCRVLVLMAGEADRPDAFCPLRNAGELCTFEVLQVPARWKGYEQAVACMSVVLDVAYMAPGSVAVEAT